MKRNIFSLYASILLKSISYIILFCYFGFIINPQWAFADLPLSSPLYFNWYDPFSPLFRIWLTTLPIVLLVLIITGSLGIIGLTSTKEKKMLSAPTYKFFIKFSSFGSLWFICSLVLAMGSNFIYTHQKFEAETWQNLQSTNYVPYQQTLRQRMVDDLTENILPGSTLDEIEALLGSSSEITGHWPQGDWVCGTLGDPDLAYYLGFSGVSPLGESLLIWFDESGNFECSSISPNG